MKETLLWQWLTGDAGSELLALSWLNPIPAWLWVLLTLGIFAFSAWSYSRLIGSLWIRSAMTLLRALAILWLVMLISGPMLIQTRERVEPDRLLWLIDRSGSIAPPGSSTRLHTSGVILENDNSDRESVLVSRDAQIKTALAKLTANMAANPKNWTHDRQLYWYGFDEQIYPINPSAISNATTNGTQIATALEAVLDEHQGHPISAVVLISDGRTPQKIGVDLLRKLKQSAVSVFTVPVGSIEQLPDIVITQVDAPQQAYTNDVVPVRVQLSLQPQDMTVDPSHVTVQLVDVQTGEVLDSINPKSKTLSNVLQLNAKAKQVGSRDWQVKVIYQPSAGEPVESNLENNEQIITVAMIDEPIRVLYIEGYPRWEYRYLKSVLMREKSIKSSIFLISADQKFAQEGDVPISRLPQTAKEFAAYDVIIIGDVPSRHFSSEQLSLIRDHVASKGAGLIWIGGARWTPVTYDTTVLANLLPMRAISAVTTIGNRPVKVVPTPLAKSLQLFEFSPPGSFTGGIDTNRTPNTTLEIKGTLPGGVRWVQGVGGLKSVVEVLAEGEFVGSSDETIPLITSLRYGAGQTLYVASDDFWRWRYAKGDVYYQPFWTQLIRLLGRGRLSQSNQATVLSTAHRRILLKQNTVVKLKTRDALLMEQNRSSMKILVERMRDGQVVDQINLLAQSSSDLTTADSTDRVYQVIWQPRHAGRLRLYPADATLAARGQIQTFLQVQHPDDEMRNPSPDHELLKQLAQQTGGKVVALDKMNELASMVPNRAQRTPDDMRYPLWHDLWVYLLFVLLITVEWILRKVCKLV